jgi:hypothetical protein
VYMCVWVCVCIYIDIYIDIYIRSVDIYRNANFYDYLHFQVLEFYFKRLHNEEQIKKCGMGGYVTSMGEMRNEYKTWQI